MPGRRTLPLTVPVLVMAAAEDQPPVHNSSAYQVTAGKGFCGLASEVRVCLEMFLNYVDKMEAINCWK